MMTMHATVLRVECNHLIVCDHCNDQEVCVHTCRRCPFCPGDQICIEFNGAMTASLPPQITACRVCCLPRCHRRHCC